MAEEQTKQKFQTSDERKMLIFVRYKPAGFGSEGGLMSAVNDKVGSVMNKIESVANSIPGLNLKEETEPEKKNDKEYNYYNDYSDWDKYINKMKDDFPEKTGSENKVLSVDFDVKDASGREQEGKRLANKIKSEASAWKDFTAYFHFVGIEQGGNVANECIKELVKESDFKKEWYVKSIIYVGTPLYKNQHSFNENEAFRGKGSKKAFCNSYDLTQQAISYLEPNDKLLKLIAESNSNPVSIFTGKIKAQAVKTLSSLSSIEGFGTSHDNTGNINKIKQVGDDFIDLAEDIKEAALSLAKPFGDVLNTSGLPAYNQLDKGWDGIAGDMRARLNEFVDEAKNAKDGVGFDSSKVNIAKIFNVFCPVVDRVTNSLKTFSAGSETGDKAFDELIDKSGIEKILAPGSFAAKVLPVDPFIEKVVELAKKAAEEKQKEGVENGTGETSKEQVFYDQSASMINACKNNIQQLTKEGDLKVKGAGLNKHQKAKIGEVFTSLILPMIPEKKKFYGRILDLIGADGSGITKKIQTESLFGYVKGFMSKIKSDFDFDEGTKEQPGLKTSLASLDTELKRIKGYINKNNFPIHKDANSLYFIYNSHNVLLKKPWGEIMNTIDKETGYLDAMKAQGFDNITNLEKNEYQGGGAQKENVQAAVAVEEEDPPA